MPLDLPLPTEAPEDDPDQYVPLLLSAIEGFLLARDVWEASDYPLARQYMNQLMQYIVDLFSGVIVRLPIGWIGEYPSNTIPSKFLLCDGQSVSRTTYAQLFAVIGTAYGAGDGSTTFNVPNFKDRSPMMPGVGNVNALGVQYGAASHTLTLAQLPAHDHDYNDPGHVHTIRIGTGGGSNALAVGTTNVANGTANRDALNSSTTGITFHGQGSNQAHNNTHPVLGVNFMIYAGV